MVKVNSEADSTAYMNVDGTATATCAEIDSTWTPIPIASLSAINTYSAATVLVAVMWRD
jgi:hypothetical protein